MIQAEVEGSDSKETQFRPETTEPVYVKQADSGHYSPFYACRSVNPLSVVLLVYIMYMCFIEYLAISFMDSTHKDQGLQMLY
jgi:hypothetical protein